MSKTFPSDTVFGRYVLLDKVGEGGMGTVYRARDTQLNRTVAIKVLHPREGMSASTWNDRKARLLREAQAAAALRHASIITLFDVGEVNGVPFLAMELIAGRTLRELQQAPGGLRRDDVLEWLRSVASALAVAHAAVIVHRDIKPENVMVRGDGLAKVLDFGIARSVNFEDGSSAQATPQLPTLTRDGVIIGTAAYMSPEQIGGEPLDGRADQFAWGVMAYELLSGRLPWGPSADSMVIVSAILTKPIPPLDTLVPTLSPAVVTVISRALTKNRTGRYASMDEVLALWPARLSDASRSFSSPTASLSSENRLRVESAGTEAITNQGVAPPSTPHPNGGEKIVSRRGQVAFVVAVVGALLVLGSASLYRHEARRAGALANARATPVDAAVSQATITLLDLPLPLSTNAAALAAYQEGLVAFRDGVLAADRSFEQAVTLDPALAEADVRRTMLLLGSADSDEQAQTLSAYRHALAARDRLSERDRALMEALEPVLLRQPADWPAAARVGTMRTSQRFWAECCCSKRGCRTRQGLLPTPSISTVGRPWRGPTSS